MARNPVQRGTPTSSSHPRHPLRSQHSTRLVFDGLPSCHYHGFYNVELEVGVVAEAGKKRAQARGELRERGRKWVRVGGELRTRPRGCSAWGSFISYDMDSLFSTGLCVAKGVVRWAMTWPVRGEGAGGGAADDVAPTSLSEGRGEVGIPALVVMFHRALKGPSGR